MSHILDLQATETNLRNHLEVLTRTIGERSVAAIWNHRKSAEYIYSFHRQIGLEPRRETYTFRREEVANIVADLRCGGTEPRTFLLGAHYDSVKGTVGADDNASGVAVQLEVARVLAELQKTVPLHLTLRLVSFALEEPPAYGTRFMGSRVYARKAREEGERLDGMICLEMVGYSNSEPGSQAYPFPLMFRNYPRTGDYIGIVGNYRSRKFTRELFDAFKKNEGLPVIKLTIPWSGYLLPTVRLSDHASFWDKGYKAVMITDTAFYRNPHYHRRSDTMDKLDYGFMAKLVESLVMFFVEQGSRG
jgi:Zn-dependent M28 family amino/carboxypeptidase